MEPTYNQTFVLRHSPRYHLWLDAANAFSGADFATLEEALTEAESPHRCTCHLRRIYHRGECIAVTLPPLVTEPEIMETIAFAGYMIHLTYEPDQFEGFWGYIIPDLLTITPRYRHKVICRDKAIDRIRELGSVAPGTTWYTI